MTPFISFFARGKPKGQPRARAFARKMGAKYVARMYDAGTADDWKEALYRELVAAIERAHWTKHAGPIAIRVDFVFPRPKGHHRANGDVKPNAPVNMTSKPDVDNCLKLVMDLVTRTDAVWQDDAQVVACQCLKRYAAPNEFAGAAVTIRQMIDFPTAPRVRVEPIEDLP